MDLRKLLSRKWLLTTILVITASLVMVRLGFWQLNRLDQRRAFNDRVLAQKSQKPLYLSGETIDENLPDMEYREVVVTGEYDLSGEIALRNQVWQNQYGVHLITPLKIAGTDQYVLVDRGWIPGDSFEAGLAKGNWMPFFEDGIITLKGVIRRSQTKADFGRIADPTPSPNGDKILAWNYVNVDQIQKQTHLGLLPLYIQQAPETGWSSLPYRSVPDLELTEGSHMGYAIQWFTFSALLFFGYPFYVYKEESRLQKRLDQSLEMYPKYSGELK